MRTGKGKMMIGRKKSVTRKPRAMSKRKYRRSDVPTLAVGQVQMEGGRVALGSTVGPYPPSLWFWNHPPTPDVRFAPFYQHAASGDPQALVDFYRKYSADPGDAFYQTIGYLAAKGNLRELNAIQKIMRINQRGGPRATSAARRESAKILEKLRLPLVQEARKWILEQRGSDQTHGRRPASREELWERYLDEHLGAAAPAELRQSLLNGPGPQQLPPRRLIRALRLTRKELQAQVRTNLRYISGMYFSRGMVPKSLFFDLARSTPHRISPSIAVRRLAEKIAI
jgi:hypothetical protein